MFEVEKQKDQEEGGGKRGERRSQDLRRNVLHS